MSKKQNKQLVEASLAKQEKALLKLKRKATRGQGFSQYAKNKVEMLWAINKELEEISKSVTEDPNGGEALVTGTEIPAMLIASKLNEGVSFKDLIEEYPELDEQKICRVSLWSKLNEKLSPHGVAEA